MQRPFFSVIIPTFNRSELLRIAIKSVLNQTYRNFELYVIDDHSTDDTKNIVKTFKDNRLKYFLNDRGRGGAGTRNCGIFKAQGEWIAFLDDDDFWITNKLQIQYKKIQSVDDSTGLIYSGFTLKSSRKRWNGHVKLPKRRGTLHNVLLYDNCIGGLSNVVIRTNLLKSLGGFDERFSAHQDLDVYVRVAAVAKIDFVPQSLVMVTLSSNHRITHNIKKKLNGCLLFWEKHSHFINRDPKLLQRAASRVFVFAFALKDISKMRKSFPYAFSGLIIDPANFLWMIKSSISLFYKERIAKKAD